MFISLKRTVKLYDFRVTLKGNTKECYIKIVLEPSNPVGSCCPAINESRG